MSSGGGCSLCYVLMLPAAEGGRKGSLPDREAEITRFIPTCICSCVTQ